MDYGIKTVAMTWNEAVVYVRKRNNKLSCSDFTEQVYIVHEDGTTFFIMNALTEREDNWIFVFWEHGVPFLLDNDSIKYFAQVKS